MRAFAHQHLDRFQIETTGSAAVGEDLFQQVVYFARNFLLDRVGRCFSCSDGVAGSAGRIWQMFPLTSTNALCRLCSLRN